MLYNPLISEPRRGASQDASMKFGIVLLPGSNCDHDAFHVASSVIGAETAMLWHKDRDLKGADCVIVPGGFSYGDYLRAGALAKFAPIMESIRDHAAKGGLVLGICNGFQVLTEVGLLPGALMRNQHLRFICRDVHLRVETTATPFTSAMAEGQVMRIPSPPAPGRRAPPRPGPGFRRYRPCRS